MASAFWTVEETRALLEVWGADSVQSSLDGIVRNRVVYERVAASLADLGYERTWQQCKNKMKNLIQRYRKVKDGNNVSGTDAKSCPFYEELDAILGTRAASSPPIVLESAANNSPEQDSGVSTLETVDETQGVCNDSSGPPTPRSPISHTPSPSTSTPVASITSVGSGSSRKDALTARKKGLKRKRVEEEGIAECLVKVFAKAEECAAEREERMRKLELEMEEKRREMDDRREDRMFAVFSAMMERVMGGNFHGPQSFQQPLPYPPPTQPPYSPYDSSQ